MTPEQALGLLDQITKNVSLNRDAHAQVQQAVDVLRVAIAPAVVTNTETPEPENA